MTQGSKVNTEFLSSLKDGAEIKSFDWCSYIVSCLNKTRIKWNGYQHYNGLLTFLLTKSKKKKVPGISFNTNESLNELDAQLINDQNIIKQESTDSKVKGKAKVDKVNLPLTLEWVVTIEEKTKELDNFVKDVELLIVKCFDEIEDDDKILPPIEEWMSRLTKYKKMRKNEEKDENDAAVNTLMVEN
ncbi:hypothetical protein E3N88_20362 [Mikania micrantha]|uniref:Uncharacterized protein n=1 Tax=Mikania micrantha TaxID=192012 RepID=A0A5N6NHY8_9ASTR|nr:hypothetical protein E3N88_20362 [Mikania micrantha]